MEYTQYIKQLQASKNRHKNNYKGILNNKERWNLLYIFKDVQ